MADEEKAYKDPYDASTGMLTWQHPAEGSPRDWHAIPLQSADVSGEDNARKFLVVDPMHDRVQVASVPAGNVPEAPQPTMPPDMQAAIDAAVAKALATQSSARTTTGASPSGPAVPGPVGGPTVTGTGGGGTPDEERE
jgi:hypothetical protein